MFDLEDGVGPNNKEEARTNLLQFFQNRKTASSSPNDYFGIVRINRVGTPWFEDDALMALKMVMGKETNVSGVALPKIEGRKDVDLISHHFLSLSKDDASFISTENENGQVSPVVSPVPLWAMVETPRAILAASEIACHPSVQGLIIGTNDLSKELRLVPPTASAIDFSSKTTREGLSTSLQLTVLAARAHDKIVIDGVYNNFRDEEGFRRECVQGKHLGMNGKTLIHPNQISATNEILAPSAEEIEYARRVVACWEDTTTANSESVSFTGVAVLDGMMIEQLHVDSAKRLLEQAAKIDSME